MKTHFEVNSGAKKQWPLRSLRAAYDAVFRKPWLAVGSSALLLGACTTLPPSGPSVMALPGTGKSFDQFRYDDVDCRQYALQQAGVTPHTAAVDSGVRSGAVGTLLGAAAGAAINGGRGAAVGAGTGMLFGGAAGVGAADQSAYSAQRQYDMGYTQCMYAKGNRVPVSGRMMTENPRGGYAPPDSHDHTRPLPAGVQPRP
ncbi:MAG: hypothetical protein NVSMB6_23020 [Burkholderiaceae bacterium]